jgi:transcriptional regulator with XRE-family HTH domain
MDRVRFGLSMRALRRRRGWTQDEVARRAGVSRSLLARVERGEGDRCAVRTLEKLAAALGSRVSVRMLWQGEELDRLLDADHAALVDEVVRRLVRLGWEVRPEQTFAIRGERGSIDILAFHAGSRQLLVIEVKSVVPDIQAMLTGLDRKARLGPLVARDLGWLPIGTSRLLVLPDDRTARRRIERFSATIDRVLPARTIEVRRWLRAPEEPLAGVVFVSGVTQAHGRHRVSRAHRDPERGG